MFSVRAVRPAFLGAASVGSGRGAVVRAVVANPYSTAQKAHARPAPILPRGCRDRRRDPASTAEQRAANGEHDRPSAHLCKVGRRASAARGGSSERHRHHRFQRHHCQCHEHAGFPSRYGGYYYSCCRHPNNQLLLLLLLLLAISLSEGLHTSRELRRSQRPMRVPIHAHRCSL